MTPTELAARQALLAARAAIDAALACLGASLPADAPKLPRSPLPTAFGQPMPQTSACEHPQQHRQAMGGFGAASEKFYCRKCGVTVS